MRQSFFKGKNLVSLTRVLLAVMMIFTASFLSLTANAAEKSVPIETSAKLVYKAGLNYVYQWQLDFTSRSHTRSTDEKTSEPVYNTVENKAKLSATARIIPVEVSTSGENVLALIVEDPTFIRIDEDNKEIEEISSELIAELKRPVFFKQLADGRVTGFYAHPDEDPSATNIKRGIISALHTVLYNDTLGKDTRGGLETDVSGSYIPLFSSAAGKDYLTITKTRDQNDYSEYPSSADISKISQDVTITDSMVSRYNVNSGVFDTVTLSSRHATLGEKDLTIPTDGVGSWSEAIGNGTLTLVRTESSPVGCSMDGYIEVSLKAADFEVPDIKEEELEKELAQLTSNPNDPKAFNNLVKVLMGNPEAVNRIKQSIQLGTIPGGLLNPVISALGSVGTPEAQGILVRDIINKREMDLISKNQALVALGMVKNPTEETVSTLVMMTGDKSDTLNSQATLILGAVVEKLWLTNPSRASIIAKNLESLLISAANDGEVELYLDAIGNSGSNASVDAIGAYLNHPSPMVRHTAVTALRKLTCDEAKNYLIQVIETETDRSIREIALNLLGSRDEEEMARIQTNYDWNYEHQIGSGSVYGKVFDQLHADNNNGNGNYYLYAKGEAKAYAWSWNWSILKGEAKSEVVAGGRKFSAKAYVLGNVVGSIEHILPCNQTRSGTLINQNFTIFNVSYSFYPYGIQVTVGISAGGNVNITYNYGMNACNAPVQVDGFATITPGGSILASGSASVSLYVVKAGVTLEAKILNTTIPTTLRGIAKTVSPYLSINFLCTLNMQPISGRLYFWAKVRRWGLFGGWRTVLSVNIWSFSSSSYTWPLINIWYYIW